MNLRGCFFINPLSDDSFIHVEANLFHKNFNRNPRLPRASNGFDVYDAYSKIIAYLFDHRSKLKSRVMLVNQK